jgi:hypothetical protein
MTAIYFHLSGATEHHYRARRKRRRAGFVLEFYRVRNDLANAEIWNEVNLGGAKLKGAERLHWA